VVEEQAGDRARARDGELPIGDVLCCVDGHVVSVALYAYWACGQFCGYAGERR
jgi:hypothetical protein